MGVIDQLGAGVTGYEIGQRVLVGAITPCGQCRACLSGNLSQCGHGDGFEALGGWRFGNTIDGAQAEYLLVPSAQANLTRIPDGVTDEQVVLLTDIASTGFSGPESGGVKIGDSVVVFAQGPIGLCATAGAKLMGASLIIGVDSDPVRLEMAKRMGADVVLDFTQVDVVAEVKRLTGGGADVTVEALGTQGTFENALRCLRPGGTLSSLGVYSGKLGCRPAGALLPDRRRHHAAGADRIAAVRTREPGLDLGMVHTGRSEVRLVGGHVLSVREARPKRRSPAAIPCPTSPTPRGPDPRAQTPDPGIAVWDNPLQSMAPEIESPTPEEARPTRWPHPARPLRC